MLAPVPRRIAVLAYEGCQSLDVLGPFEVFAAARHFRSASGAPDAGYEPMLVGFDGGPVRTESGVRLTPDLTDHELLEQAPLDTLIIVGGSGVAPLVRDADMLARVRRLAQHARRTAAVCTGAYLLAASGLLAGRRATTHWEHCDQLAALFPDVQVVRDVIFVQDEQVWTSAGVLAGIDLALALVEQDHGPQLVAQIARQLVVFVRRAGGQRQLSAPLALQASERPRMRDLAAWASEQLGADLSLPALAKRCGMSVRSFARAFREELGTTPARYVETLRLDSACRLLELSDKSIDEIASACGFGSHDALGRALSRSRSLTPSAYRAQHKPRREPG